MKDILYVYFQYRYGITVVYFPLTFHRAVVRTSKKQQTGSACLTYQTRKKSPFGTA